MKSPVARHRNPLEAEFRLALLRGLRAPGLLEPLRQLRQHLGQVAQEFPNLVGGNPIGSVVPPSAAVTHDGVETGILEPARERIAVEGNRGGRCAHCARR